MKRIDRRGLCLVLAGPSGGGKSSLAHTLLSQEQDLQLSISATTRPPRPSEREAADYYFRSDAEFDQLIARGELLEWAQVLGQYRYGTPREPVLQVLASGRDMLFDIDWQGFRSLRTALPGDVVGLFLLPPSLAALETRLRVRGGDDPAEIARRMERARGEIAHCAEFDHVVVNDDFQQTVAAARAILTAARTMTARLFGLAATLAELSS
jgi:guanylate kinase